ncbi:MAG: DUF4351 domain-containing protein [Magnetococcales bacterium]|nr:DUF4351 domain-containing protein [Magnetococcales bacterium]
MENDVLRPLFQKAQTESKQEGKAEMLLRQMQRRFGAVPESVQKRVVSADSKELDTWSDRIFDADSAQAVLQ